MVRLEPNCTTAPKWSPGLETAKAQAKLNSTGAAAGGMDGSVNTLTNQVVQLGIAFELVVARLNSDGTNAPAIGESGGLTGFRH